MVLWTLIKAAILLCNALAILHEGGLARPPFSVLRQSRMRQTGALTPNRARACGTQTGSWRNVRSLRAALAPAL
jgi:hypothetical protein